jgi:DNA-binding CsgD family transcriptional regulator/tetratricopeptide (TPR) repeat protein
LDVVCDHLPDEGTRQTANTIDRVARRLLERDQELATLMNAAREAAAGIGSVVLLHGEAGIGKTSLVSAIKSQLPSETRMLIGSCDALSTPRTLGPFRDLACVVGPRLAEALQAGERDLVMDALLDELHRPPPSTLVVEDVHWADEATVDTLRFLVRRIAQLPVVLLLTYRDDELSREHPLAQLLGDASHTEQVHHLSPRRLSEPAVRTLVGDSPLDAEEVFALSDGNPYFVSELVASAVDSSVPPTVVDAVLSRPRRLAPAHQDTVELLAIVPSAIDRHLVDALANDHSAIEAAEARGLLTVQPDQVSFRHELTRRAIADALPVARRMELNAHVLSAMEDLGIYDASRLVHHASEAGDVDALVRYAPIAARDAATSAAHREAAAHFALALAHEDRFTPPELADFFEECAVERYTIGAAGDAVTAQRRAVALRWELEDQRVLGLSLRWLSRMLWFNGMRAGADEAAQEATAVLGAVGDDGLFAFALSNQSQLAMLAHRTEEAETLARRAIALATAAGATPVLSHALTNLGLARWMSGDHSGFDDLHEAVRVALSIDDVEDACRAYVGIVWSLLDEFRLDEAEPFMSEALALAEQAEFIGFLAYLQACRARLELARGRWEAAVAVAELPQHSQPAARCTALTVLGTVRLRLGQPGATELLAEAQRLAEQMDELQRIGPVAAARCEHAALQGDWAAVVEIAEPVFALAVQLGDQNLQAELAYRLRMAGRAVDPPDVDHPFAVQTRGDWRAAAEIWATRGCPYHQAAALADSSDPAALLEALSISDSLGATPLARRVRTALRQLGVPNVPRGPMAGTRENPAGLTDRQLEVLRLLARGLTNGEIATQLVLSVRTVDRHVAEILAKLGVTSRRQAAARAEALGITSARA